MNQGTTGVNSLPAEIEKGVSLWLDAWRRLRKNRLALAGLAILVVVTLVAAAGPLFSPTAMGAGRRLGRRRLSAQWLARYSRPRSADRLYGGRVSLGVGLAATAVSS